MNTFARLSAISFIRKRHTPLPQPLNPKSPTKTPTGFPPQGFLTPPPPSSSLVSGSNHLPPRTSRTHEILNRSAEENASTLSEHVSSLQTSAGAIPTALVGGGGVLRRAPLHHFALSCVDPKMERGMAIIPAPGNNQKIRGASARRSRGGAALYFPSVLSVFPQCSASCGVGVQNRDVYCRLKGSGRVRDDACDARRRPAEARPCRRAECALYTWAAGDWEEVSSGSPLRVSDEHG